MNMQIKQVGDVVFAYPHGRLDLDATFRFEESMNRILKNNEGMHICINCSFIEYINSTNLRVIITTARKLIEQEKKLFLCNISGPITKLLNIIPLDKIIELKDSEDDVLAESDFTAVNQ